MVAVRLVLTDAPELPGLHRDAITYAIAELARRAGISAAHYDSWEIRFSGAAFVDVYLQPGTKKRIRFPRSSATRWREIRDGRFRTSQASWVSENKISRDEIPDFPIPFSSADTTEVGPLFFRDAEDSFACSVDLPLSTLLTLSRFEETFPGERDVHDRFSAFSSVAWRNGFLHRPVVDEYGLALEQVLLELLPGWTPTKRELRVKLSHDVDEIGIPFSLRGALARTLRDHQPLATMRDLLACGFGTDTAYQFYLRKIVQLSMQKGIHPAVYWKSSKPGPFDTGYDLNEPHLLKMIRELRSQGVELGVHPGYVSYQRFDVLRSEVQALREVLGEDDLGGRQDYLRWSPQTWSDWDALGLAYDSSVGFADCVGFRAGTAIPFHPWLWKQQRKAKLVEIPLVAMDSTLLGYMRLSPPEIWRVLRELVNRCRTVGGVFTLAWHNTRILDRELASTYQLFLDEVAGCPTLDWRTT